MKNLQKIFAVSLGIASVAAVISPASANTERLKWQNEARKHGIVEERVAAIPVAPVLRADGLRHYSH